MSQLLSESKLEVGTCPLGKAVYARTSIEEGEVVVAGWGPRVKRGAHSFQVGPDTHIRIRNEIELINHSCDPNCGVVLPLGVELMQAVALRRIEPGEELTTDYAMHDFEILYMPDRCGCGSALCRGRITGYRDLPLERRAAYGPYVAEYLPLLDAALRSGARDPAL